MAARLHGVIVARLHGVIEARLHGVIAAKLAPVITFCTTCLTQCLLRLAHPVRFFVFVMYIRIKSEIQQYKIMEFVMDFLILL